MNKEQKIRAKLYGYLPFYPVLKSPQEAYEETIKAVGKLPRGRDRRAMTKAIQTLLNTIAVKRVHAEDKMMEKLFDET